MQNQHAYICTKRWYWIWRTAVHMLPCLHTSMSQEESEMCQGLCFVNGWLTCSSHSYSISCVATSPDSALRLKLLSFKESNFNAVSKTLEVS